MHDKIKSAIGFSFVYKISYYADPSEHPIMYHKLFKELRNQYCTILSKIEQQLNLSLSMHDIHKQIAEYTTDWVLSTIDRILEESDMLKKDYNSCEFLTRI